MPSATWFCRSIRSLALPGAIILLISATAAMPTVAQMASPRSGEGIYSLLERNGIQPTSAAVAEFKSLNSRLLTRNGGLRRGASYTLPSTGNVRVGLFGDEHAIVEQKSTELQGVAYFLVSGHGGRDPGAIGTREGRSLYEDEYAYDIMLRIAKGLMEHSAEVHVMVQDDDGIRDERFLRPDRDEKNIDGSPVSSTRRVRERVEHINRLARKSDARIKRVVEIHVDARENKSTQVDVHFYYTSPAGRRLSTILMDTMDEQYRIAQPGRGYNGKVSSRGLHTLVHSSPVATYVELGNIHQSRDQRRIIEPGNRQAIANWMVLGLRKELATIQ